MPEVEITCIRCGHSGPPGPEGACPRCGTSLNLLETAQLPRPAVVLPEMDPDKLVKRGAAVPVLAAAAAVALVLAGGGAWFASRRAASAGRPAGAAPPIPAPLSDGASPSSAPLQAATAAPAPARPPIAVAAADADAAYAEPTRSTGTNELRHMSDRAMRQMNDSPPQRPAPQPGSRRTGVEIRSASVVEPPSAPEAPALVRPSAAPGPAAPPVAPAGPAPSGSGAVALPPPSRSTELVEDAPRFALEGFQKPRMAEPGCVQAAVRLPRDLAARVVGPVTVKFAVGVDGTVGLFEVVGDVPDRRVTDALRSAIQSCRFLPGADAQGRKTRLWVVMPIRFER